MSSYYELKSQWENFQLQYEEPSRMIFTIVTLDDDDENGFDAAAIEVDDDFENEDEFHLNDHEIENEEGWRLMDDEIEVGLSPSEPYCDIRCLDFFYRKLKKLPPSERPKEIEVALESMEAVGALTGRHNNHRDLAKILALCQVHSFGLTIRSRRVRNHRIISVLSTMVEKLKSIRQLVLQDEAEYCFPFLRQVLDKSRNKISHIKTIDIGHVLLNSKTVKKWTTLLQKAAPWLEGFECHPYFRHDQQDVLRAFWTMFHGFPKLKKFGLKWQRTSLQQEWLRVNQEDENDQRTLSIPDDLQHVTAFLKQHPKLETLYYDTHKYNDNSDGLVDFYHAIVDHGSLNSVRLSHLANNAILTDFLQRILRQPMPPFHYHASAGPFMLQHKKHEIHTDATGLDLVLEEEANRFSKASLHSFMQIIASSKVRAFRIKEEESAMANLYDAMVYLFGIPECSIENLVVGPSYMAWCDYEEYSVPWLSMNADTFLQLCTSLNHYSKLRYLSLQTMNVLPYEKLKTPSHLKVLSLNVPGMEEDWENITTLLQNQPALEFFDLELMLNNSELHGLIHAGVTIPSETSASSFIQTIANHPSLRGFQTSFDIYCSFVPSTFVSHWIRQVFKSKTLEHVSLLPHFKTQKDATQGFHSDGVEKKEDKEALVKAIHENIVLKKLSWTFDSQILPQRIEFSLLRNQRLEQAKTLFMPLSIGQPAKTLALEGLWPHALEKLGTWNGGEEASTIFWALVTLDWCSLAGNASSSKIVQSNGFGYKTPKTIKSFRFVHTSSKIQSNRFGHSTRCQNCGAIGHNAADCWGNGWGQPVRVCCQKCGAIGHKSADCWGKPENACRFRGRCRNCGVSGHKEAKCWEKPENASQRPKGWQSKFERGNGTNYSNRSSGGKKCWHCGESGHVKANCPKH